MNKSQQATVVLLVVILFILGIFLGFRIERFLYPRGAARVYNTPVLVQQVQTLSDLVTVKYVVQKVEIWEDPPSGLITQFVGGNNRILLLAQGVVKAGVDLNKLKPDDLKIKGKTIWINLPAAHVTDAYLDDKETKVIERTTGFLRSFDKDLEQNVRRTAVEDMRLSAGRGGILQDAEQRARTQLASFFTLMGFERVEFQLSPAPIPGLGLEETRVLEGTNAIQDRTVPQIHSP